MLTDAEIRTLRQQEDTLHKAVGWLLLLFPVALVVMGNVNLFVSVHMSASAGISVGDLVSTALNGVDSGTHYEGVFVKALEVFRRAMMQGVAAVVFAIVVFANESTKRLHARVLETLEECGALVGSGAAQSDRAE
jgi:hypothetical protein